MYVSQLGMENPIKLDPDNCQPKMAFCLTKMYFRINSFACVPARLLICKSICTHGI